jgi:hypothetical protein
MNTIIAQWDVSKILLAAGGMDWQQVVRNNQYGPPCFHLDEDGRFCGRAKGWDGHDICHTYVSLYDLIKLVIAIENEACAVLGGHVAETYNGKPRYFPDGQAVADAIRARRS